MSAVLKIETQLETHTCGQCGIIFAAPAYFWAERSDRGGNWYCPNGHCRAFTETLQQKYEKQLALERQRTLAAQNQTRMEREQREKAERKLRRVEKGTCPKCNRHFVNVERHMQSKHKGKP